MNEAERLGVSCITHPSAAKGGAVNSGGSGGQYSVVRKATSDVCLANPRFDENEEISAFRGGPRSTKYDVSATRRSPTVPSPTIGFQE